jgi:hypothetical protein
MRSAALPERAFSIGTASGREPRSSSARRSRLIGRRRLASSIRSRCVVAPERGSVRMIRSSRMVEVVDRHRLDAQIERSGFPRRCDARLDEPQELVEDRVLELDAKREQPVQPALDRRQVLAQAATFAFELQPGQLLEAAEGDGRAFREQQMVPADQRVLGVAALQIVGWDRTGSGRRSGAGRGSARRASRAAARSSR